MRWMSPIVDSYGAASIRNGDTANITAATARRPGTRFDRLCIGDVSPGVAEAAPYGYLLAHHRSEHPQGERQEHRVKEYQHRQPRLGHRQVWFWRKDRRRAADTRNHQRHGDG